MSKHKPALRDYRRNMGGNRAAFFGTVIVHGMVAGLLFTKPTVPDFAAPPVYNVQLVAAPRPEPQERPAPEAVERPARQRQPVRRPPRMNVAEAPPPPETQEADREPAPRTAPEAEPLPDEEPSTGDDPASLSVSGVNFPFPEYLSNIVAQIYRRWRRPPGNESLRAEILFLVRGDGSISNLQFVQRSGNFAFDVQAQGAIESAGTAGVFGPLPDGFEGDILPVSFFFDPRTLRR